MDRIRQGEAGVFGWCVFILCCLFFFFFWRVSGETPGRLANPGESTGLNDKEIEERVGGLVITGI